MNKTRVNTVAILTQVLLCDRCSLDEFEAKWAPLEGLQLKTYGDDWTLPPLEGHTPPARYTIEGTICPEHWAELSAIAKAGTAV